MPCLWTWWLEAEGVLSKESSLVLRVYSSSQEWEGWEVGSLKMLAVQLAENEHDNSSLLDTLSPKPSGTLKRNSEGKENSIYDLRETLREYNWGITTNYLSIYILKD